jgi:AraC-like DNA-binding protein
VLTLRESLRWGEPVIETDQRDTLYWGVPLMVNARLVGGLVSWISERRLFPEGAAAPALDLMAAAADLRRLAEEHNVTNAAALAGHREAAARERQRAEAIHAFKRSRGSSVRAAYLLEEPALLAAIRAGDQGEARAVLNRLLVRMIHAAGERRDLVKSLFLELVVSLSRTAVEAGAAAQELLGAHYSSMTQLAALDDDEQIAAWLRTTLDRILDALARRSAAPDQSLVARVLAYIEEHCVENISRRRVAAAMGVSESHLARRLSAAAGVGIPQIINQKRIARACEILARTDQPLKIIALRTGFADQSYFTKVFRRYAGVTPGGYRLTHQPPPSTKLPKHAPKPQSRRRPAR